VKQKRHVLLGRNYAKRSSAGRAVQPAACSSAAHCCSLRLTNTKTRRRTDTLTCRQHTCDLLLFLHKHQTFSLCFGVNFLLRLYAKWRVKLCLCSSGSGGIAPLIELGSACRWVVSCIVGGQLYREWSAVS